jgi:uncharacterized protein YkwD
MAPWGKQDTNWWLLGLMLAMVGGACAPLAGRGEAARGTPPLQSAVAPAAVAPAAPPVTWMRDAIAADALTAALVADLAEAAAGVRLDPLLRRVAEAAAWSASREEVISDSEVHSAMIATLRSGVSPHLLTAWLRPAQRRRAGPGVEATAIDQEDLQALYRSLGPELRELVASAEVDSFAVSVRGGPGGVVAVVAALPPPRLPFNVEHQGQRAIVTAPWSRLTTPAAFLVTPQTSVRVAAARIGDSVQIVVPCRRQDVDLELSDGAGLFASLVDVCNPTDPRWAAFPGDIGPAATTEVELEQRAFELLNRERRRHDLVPLIWDPRAQEMARRHSRDLAEHRRVSHVGSDGTTLDQRIAWVALPARATFENVGRAGGPGEIHQGFMTSRGHRENLLEPTARYGAVGVASDRQRHELYFTQVLYAPLEPAEPRGVHVAEGTASRQLPANPAEPTSPAPTGSLPGPP